MALIKTLTYILAALLLMIFVSGAALSSSESNGGKREAKAMEHWLPLMFMMNGSQMAQASATWIIGVISLGVTLLLRNEVFTQNF